MIAIPGLPHRGTSRGPVVLGPLDAGGHVIRLRPPTFDDHSRWRALRLRDRAAIEPFWSRSGQSWENRHSRNEWVREVMAARRSVASGRALPCVIEVDGHLAGQIGLTAIDTDSRTAELGVWISSDLARSGVVTVAGGMIVDHALAQLGVDRVVAPSAAHNVAAARAMSRAGFRREATLPGWAPTGGHDVVAHDLWVIGRDDLGPGGLTTVGLRRTDPDTSAVDIVAHTRPARSATVPRRLDDIVAVLRYDAGRLRVRALHLVPPPVPARIDVDGTALRLRRRPGPLIDAIPTGARRAARFDDVCTPIRNGAWFDTDDADVVYDVLHARRRVGRISLVGVNRRQGFAELAVSLDRAAPAASDRAVGHAVREMLREAVRVLCLRRISTTVAPTDARAARVADVAGLRHETSLDGAACGRPPGMVEIWAVSAPAPAPAAD
ncbi:GNAT family N-acetyltransferase [Williamsia sp. SKLECPSW1]